MNDLLTRARDAARHASDAILPLYGNTAFELKDDNSPVTVADGKAHEAIMEVLETTGIPVLSEEGVGRLLPYPERLWIVDPLDGTKGFLKHTDDFAVMIALIENGRPIIAVVDAPVLKKQYYATLGGGAFLYEEGSERQLHVSARTRPNLRGLLSVNHRAPYMDVLTEKLAVAETVSIGSIGIKAGYIAEDRADFYVTRGALGEWDVCAPELILTEAGGKATDERGELLCYGNEDGHIKHGIVFSNGSAHEDVLHALEKIP